MIPLTALRTAQLFQISWPLISSIVGILNGSISFEEEEEAEEEEEDSGSDIVFVSVV